MSIRIAALALVLGMLGACASTPPGPPRLESLWTTIGFDEPARTILSAEEEFLYVSNVDGEASERDGAGHISTVALDGTVLERRWADGLDAPKGMALDGAGLLWVSDIKRLVALDAVTGALRESRVIGPSRGLEDVARLPDGQIVVADPERATIYAKTEDGHRVWLQDDRLDGVSGLFAQDVRLLVTTKDGRVLAIDYVTKNMGLLAGGLGVADGIAQTRRGDLVISDAAGRLIHIGEDAVPAPVLETGMVGISQDDLVHVGKDVFVVTNRTPGTLSAWKMRQ